MAPAMVGKQPKPVKLGAFGQYFKEYRAPLMKESAGPNGDRQFFAATKLGNLRFKELGDVEKARYQELYEEAKQQYEEDLNTFLRAGGVMKMKDPKKPKRPVGGAYWCFISKNRAEIMKECPGKSIAVVSRLASERWKQLNDVQRLPFDEEFQAKRARYQEEMKSYVPPAKSDERATCHRPREVLQISESSDESEEVDFPDILDIEDDESEVDVSDSSDEHEKGEDKTGASEAATTASSASDEQVFTPPAAAAGCNVMVHGLVAMAQFNGKRGKLIRYL